MTDAKPFPKSQQLAQVREGGMTLVEQLRAVGLSMGTAYAPYTHEPDANGDVKTTRRYTSWTTDEAKAHEARELGATVSEVRSSDPRFTGWEVTTNVVES